MLGKLLKDIKIDKIYVGMKVAFTNKLKNGILYGKVVLIKRNTPFKVSIADDGTLIYGDPYDGIIIDWDNGPLTTANHVGFDRIYYAE